MNAQKFPNEAKENYANCFTKLREFTPKQKAEMQKNRRAYLERWHIIHGQLLALTFEPGGNR